MLQATGLYTAVDALTPQSWLTIITAYTTSLKDIPRRKKNAPWEKWIYLALPDKMG